MIGTGTSLNVAVAGSLVLYRLDGSSDCPANVTPGQSEVRDLLAGHAAPTARLAEPGLSGGAPGLRVLHPGETADTRAAQVASYAGLEETGALRRTIGTDPLALLEPAVLSEATDWMDRKRA